MKQLFTLSPLIAHFKSELLPSSERRAGGRKQDGDGLEVETAASSRRAAVSMAQRQRAAECVSGADTAATDAEKKKEEIPETQKSG